MDKVYFTCDQYNLATKSCLQTTDVFTAHDDFNYMLQTYVCITMELKIGTENFIKDQLMWFAKKHVQELCGVCRTINWPSMNEIRRKLAKS